MTLKIKNQKSKIKNSEGITLLLMVVILSALLSISVGIFNVVLGQIQISGDLNDSFIAFYAATEAMEKVLFMDRNLGICTGASGDPCAQGPINIASGGCYKMRVVKSASDTSLETVGQYRCGASPSRVVKRRLLLTYTNN